MYWKIRLRLKNARVVLLFPHCVWSYYHRLWSLCTLTHWWINTIIIFVVVSFMSKTCCVFICSNCPSGHTGSFTAHFVKHKGRLLALAVLSRCLTAALINGCNVSRAETPTHAKSCAPASCHTCGITASPKWNNTILHYLHCLCPLCVEADAAGRRWFGLKLCVCLQRKTLSVKLNNTGKTALLQRAAALERLSAVT